MVYEVKVHARALLTSTQRTLMSGRLYYMIIVLPVCFFFNNINISLKTRQTRSNFYMNNTYITEDGARISELSEERVLCGGESIIVRLRFIFLVIPLVLDLQTRNKEKSKNG